MGIKLNLDDINAVIPYKLTASTADSNTFWFTTDYGVTYAISFTLNNLLFGIDAYEFAIVNTNNRKSPRDSKLRQTVQTFIYEFFKEPKAVLLYLCETGDNKQRSRNRLFESWFKSSSHKSELVYLTSSICDDEDVTNYFGLITRNDNPNLPQILTEFGETVLLFSEKPE